MIIKEIAEYIPIISTICATININNYGCTTRDFWALIPVIGNIRLLCLDSEKIKQDFLFFVTLTYTCFRVKFSKWSWCNVIGEEGSKIILGAVPLESKWTQIQVQHKIRHVLSVMEEHEQRRGSVFHPISPNKFDNNFRLPFRDFSEIPDLEKIDKGVEFIHANREEGVYIHCKAGRARSATVVICYLLKYKKNEIIAFARDTLNKEISEKDSSEMAETAKKFLKKYRIQISVGTNKTKTITEYFKNYCVEAK